MRRWIAIPLVLSSAIALVLAGIVLGDRRSAVSQSTEDPDLGTLIYATAQLSSWADWLASSPTEEILSFCKQRPSAAQAIADCLRGSSVLIREVNESIDAVLLEKEYNPDVILRLSNMDCIPPPGIRNLEALNECLSSVAR